MAVELAICMGMADSGTQAPLRVDLHHGDCLEVMPTLAAGSVAMCFADLPYTVTAAQWDLPANLPDLWRNFEHILNGTKRAVFSAVQPFATDLIMSNRRAFKYDIIWHKARCSNFYQAKKQPMRQHEIILVFASRPGTYNAQKTAGRIRSDSYSQRADIFHLNDTRYQHCGTGQKNPTTILKVDESDTMNSRILRFHPTQKPVALLKWLIKTYSNAGDTVLDPVSGSATTAIAAIRNGRNAVCIEKDATYFAAGVERVKAEIAASGVVADLVIHD